VSFRSAWPEDGLGGGEGGGKGRGHSAGRGCRAEMRVARPGGACAVAMGAAMIGCWVPGVKLRLPHLMQQA
jgi:hypothetical protein